MDKVDSCGFLIFRDDTDKRGKTKRNFLLMRHADRWDLPKGHVDPGEKKKQCALRELEEETNTKCWSSRNGQFVHQDVRRQGEHDQFV